MSENENENENQINIIEEEKNEEHQNQDQEQGNIIENNNNENNENDEENEENDGEENNEENEDEENNEENEVQPQIEIVNENIQAENQINNDNNNINNEANNQRIRQEEENKVIEIIKSKIKYLREKYDFCLQFEEIILKILKSFQDLTYTKLSASIKESLNFITFFKESSELYSKFAKQIQETNNIIMSSKKVEKLSDNVLLDVMQNTQNILLENITTISKAMKQNIVNKGPLSLLQEKINQIDNKKKENFDKLKLITESRKKLQKKMAKYEKIFESFLPKININLNNNNNNNQIMNERPILVDTPDFILIIKSLLGYINKLILEINLYIIETKDTFYNINSLYVQINNLVKESILIYIKECKTIFNLNLTKNFSEIEEYYKKLEEKDSDKMFKLNKIFSTRETSDYVHNLLQQYYMLLVNSNCVRKELLKDRNNFSIKYSCNVFSFFEWFISVSPQPIDISIADLIIKQLNVKRDPGFFSSWKDCIFIFTKQKHLLIFDKPGGVDDLVKIFELGKTSFRKRTDKKNKLLFELIANQKGKIMDFKGTFLFDAISNQNIEEIPNIVYSAYNN